jgi:hypothetical protein
VPTPVVVAATPLSPPAMDAWAAPLPGATATSSSSSSSSSSAGLVGSPGGVEENLSDSSSSRSFRYATPVSLECRVGGC